MIDGAGPAASPLHGRSLLCPWRRRFELGGEPEQQHLVAEARGELRADRQLVGAGNVGSGQYVLALSRTASFNGSSVVLEVQQGRRRYALLLAEDGPPRPAIIQFAGKTLPERTALICGSENKPQNSRGRKPTTRAPNA